MGAAAAVPMPASAAAGGLPSVFFFCVVFLQVSVAAVLSCVEAVM